MIEQDHADALQHNRTPIVRFYVPADYSWQALRNHPPTARSASSSPPRCARWPGSTPTCQGVLDVKDYNERQSGQRTLDDDRLAALIEVISRHRLGLKNAEPGHPRPRLRVPAAQVRRGPGPERRRVLHAQGGRLADGRAARPRRRCTHRLRSAPAARPGC